MIYNRYLQHCNMDGNGIRNYRRKSTCYNKECCMYICTRFEYLRVWICCFAQKYETVALLVYIIKKKFLSTCSLVIIYVILGILRNNHYMNEHLFFIIIVLYVIMCVRWCTLLSLLYLHVIYLTLYYFIIILLYCYIHVYYI